MKNRFVVLVAAVLPLLCGCTDANSEPGNTNSVAAAKSATVTNAPAPDSAALAEVPAGQVVSTEPAPPPANLKLTPAASEIVKLAQSGVDPTVMLAYVTNSIHTFNLAADEIVYLNDLGLSPSVVTAMIQHDQRIREASVNGAVAASPATPAPQQSVWASSTPEASNTWQQPAAELAPAASSEVSTTVPPPPEAERPDQVTVDYFYDSLAPYGTWIDINGYGRCWRPTIVASYAGWAPYRHGGRWVWTNQGWYWYSDYSWGWAPFHYGRWFSHPRWGWCWTPGTVWGPAWVSWRYSDDYYGWAPLPPAAYYSPSIGFTYYGSSCGSGFSFGLTWDYFTFVSYNNFHRHHYDRHCVPHHQAGQVYNHTTVVNNIINGNNNTIINHGIGTDRITAATGTPIHPTTIRTAGGPRNPRNTRHEHLAQDGSTLTVNPAPVPSGPGRHGGSGTTRTTRGGTHGPSTGSGVASSSPAPASPGTTQPSTPPIVRGVDRSTRGGGITMAPAAIAPTTTSGPASPGASAQSTATPPTSRGVDRSTRGGGITMASAATAPTSTTEPAPRGALIIRNSRAPKTSTDTTASAPVPAGNASGTPWLNNQTTPASPANSHPSQSGNIRPGRQPGNAPASVPNTSQHNPRSFTPQPAQPTYQAPAATPTGRSTPPRVFGAPAPPQPVQAYTPPARTHQTHSTPAPQAPAYTQPSRQPQTYSAPPPSRSSPPGTRSAPQQSPGSSSSRSSDSSDSKGSRSRSDR